MKNLLKCKLTILPCNIIMRKKHILCKGCIVSPQGRFLHGEEFVLLSPQMSGVDPVGTGIPQMMRRCRCRMFPATAASQLPFHDYLISRCAL
jgi:hypothetical protein